MAGNQPVRHGVDWGRSGPTPASPLSAPRIGAGSPAVAVPGGPPVARPAGLIPVKIVDAFFQDLDHSMRELGIGDQGVPKRMKKFAGMFYGRLESYAAAIDGADADALAAALRRNTPTTRRWKSRPDANRPRSAGSPTTSTR